VIFPKGRRGDLLGHARGNEFVLRVNHEEREAGEDAQGAGCVENLEGGREGGRKS